MTIATMTAFFGWCTVVAVALNVVTAVAVMLFKDLVVRINGKLFGMSEAAVMQETFAYLGRFKLMVTLFAFVPWLALKLMT